MIVFVGTRAAELKDTTCLFVAGTSSLLAGLTKELGDHLGVRRSVSELSSASLDVPMLFNQQGRLETEF